MASKQRQTARPTSAASSAAALAPDAGAKRIAQRGSRLTKGGNQLRPSAAAAEEERIARHNAAFDLTAAIAYHAIREQFLGRLNRFLTGLQVLFGTGAIVALTDAVDFGPEALIALSAVAGVVLLVMDPAGAAREHRGYRSRLHNLLADLTDGQIAPARVEAEMQRVMADAPPAYRAVQAIAYNTAVDAMYAPPDRAGKLFKVGWLRRPLANFLPMRGVEFEPQD